LISSYYAPRWELYFDSLETALKTDREPKPIDWYTFGDNWNRSAQRFPADPSGDPYAMSLTVAKALGLAPQSDAPVRKQ
jgi:alpha-N-acetylglucosaminidase